MLRNALKMVLVMIAATGCALLVGSFEIGNESIIMIFLLGVLFTAMLTSSRSWAIFAAMVSVMTFNFLFTEPRYSFFIYRTNDLMLMAFFLVTGIVSGTITSRLQCEMELATRNERTAKIMYRIASGFLPLSGKENVIRKAEDIVSEYVEQSGKVVLAQKGQPLPEGGYDICSKTGVVGRLVLPEEHLEAHDLLLVQAVCTQLGIALERESLVTDRENIRFAMEREQQRSTLLRSIAHDLRTPLTALSGAGNLLADSYDILSNAERRKLATDISEEIAWLTDLVENILNMTRISEQKLVLHKQDEVIDDVIGEAVKHTERLLHGRDFHVVLPDEVVAVPMDGKLIAQVIINLLENAVRHTSPDSRIVLTAKAGEQLTVSVADTGEGIPPELKEHLFERFVTLNKEVVDGRRGLGLGLSICKAVVEAHGGQITVCDNQPVGSVFTFTLPMEDRS